MENLLAKALSKESAAFVVVGVMFAGIFFNSWQVYNHLPSQISELKTDINKRMERMEGRMDRMEDNMVRMEERLEDRMERMEDSLLKEIRLLREKP